MRSIWTCLLYTSDIPTIATTLSVENLRRPEDTATGNIKVNDKLLYTKMCIRDSLLDTGKSVTIATGSGERTGRITDILQLTEAEKTAGIRYYLTEETVHAQEWKLTGAAAGDPGVPLETSEAGGVTYIALPGFTDKADVSVTATNRYAKADITRCV